MKAVDGCSPGARHAGGEATSYPSTRSPGGQACSPSRKPQLSPSVQCRRPVGRPHSTGSRRDPRRPAVGLPVATGCVASPQPQPYRWQRGEETEQLIVQVSRRWFCRLRVHPHAHREEKARHPRHQTLRGPNVAMMQQIIVVQWTCHQRGRGPSLFSASSMPLENGLLRQAKARVWWCGEIGCKQGLQGIRMCLITPPFAFQKHQS